MNISKNEIEKMFENSINVLKNIAVFCDEEAKERTQDIIDIETAVKIVLEEQEKIKKTLIEKADN